MPTISVSTGERKLAQEIAGYVKNFATDLSPEGRLVLAVELIKLLRPEIEELERVRKVGNGGA